VCFSGREIELKLFLVRNIVAKCLLAYFMSNPREREREKERKANDKDSTNKRRKKKSSPKNEQKSREDKRLSTIHVVKLGQGAKSDDDEGRI
jgi:hypothetical protein